MFEKKALGGDLPGGPLQKVGPEKMLGYRSFPTKISHKSPCINRYIYTYYVIENDGFMEVNYYCTWILWVRIFMQKSIETGLEQQDQSSQNN